MNIYRYMITNFINWLNENYRKLMLQNPFIGRKIDEMW